MDEKLYSQKELDLRLIEQHRQLTQMYSEIMDSIILGMASVIESRDDSTGQHVRRTSRCASLFAEKLKERREYDISDEFASCVTKAAPMHDLGKLKIPDSVLQKPGRFTDDDYAVMKNHSVYGAALIYEVFSEIFDEDFIHIAINMAYFHHEKWDGSGYPKGLKGEEIPFEARIMALADVFDALVSKRCYKDSFSYDEVFHIIEASLGTHFDPKLGREFLSIRADIEKLYDELLAE